MPPASAIGPCAVVDAALGNAAPRSTTTRAGRPHRVRDDGAGRYRRRPGTTGHRAARGLARFGAALDARCGRTSPSGAPSPGRSGGLGSWQGEPRCGTDARPVVSRVARTSRGQSMDGSAERPGPAGDRPARAVGVAEPRTDADVTGTRRRDVRRRAPVRSTPWDDRAACRRSRVGSVLVGTARTASRPSSTFHRHRPAAEPAAMQDAAS